MEEVKRLSFDTSVSSMEYVADGEVLVITYGKTIAFYNALRSTDFTVLLLEERLLLSASRASRDAVPPCFELANNRTYFRFLDG